MRGTQSGQVDPHPCPGDARQSICIVGPSPHFLSGITYYTYGLCNALSEVCDVSVILLRRLLPRRLYPGHTRVGAPLATLALDPAVACHGELDWYWGRELPRALRLLARQRPSALLLPWWTGTVLHTYLVLALAARLLHIRIIVEFHEVLDTGEQALPWAKWYVQTLAPLLFGQASAYVVHSRHEAQLLQAHYRLEGGKIAVIPHATYDHYSGERRNRTAPPNCCNLLFFGLIRPYKGLEDLLQAFAAIPEEEIAGYWLTIAGETWEGGIRPVELVSRHPYRDRITILNRYLCDAEVDAVFGGADALVVPYRRASQSGALHIALHYGLAVIVTAVGGLVEAVADYEGAIMIQPGNSEELLAAFRAAAALRGQRFVSPRSWADTAEGYRALLSSLSCRR